MRKITKIEILILFLPVLGFLYTTWVLASYLIGFKMVESEPDAWWWHSSTIISAASTAILLCILTILS